MKRGLLFILMLSMALAFCASASAAIPSIDEALLAKDITKAKSLYVKPSSAAVRLGNDGTGTTLSIKANAKPFSASQVFNWTSSDTAIATVDSSGVVTPHAIGKVKINCATTDLSNLKRAVTVYVKPLKVQTITLDKTDISLVPNSKATIGFTLTPANAYDTSVKWSTSNANVATVAADGTVTAKKFGSCVITCKSPSSGVTAKAKVNVTMKDSDIYYLSIGQQNYVKASRLIGCKMDADRFAATVKASTFGNTSSPTGTVLYDQTAPQIKAALNGLSGLGMDENDVTYVYYSGHGSGYANYEGALIGIEYSGTSTIASTCVKVSDIRAALDKVPGTVVIVIDACYSGNFITSKSADAFDFTSAFVKTFSRNIGSKSIIDENELKDKYKLMIACQPDELSYMIGNNYGSVFTMYAMQAGGVWGADVGTITVKNKMAGDANGDKTVSLKEVYSYAYSRIMKFMNKAYGTGIVTQRMMVWPTADSYPVFARLS